MPPCFHSFLRNLRSRWEKTREFDHILIESVLSWTDNLLSVFFYRLHSVRLNKLFIHFIGRVDFSQFVMVFHKRSHSLVRILDDSFAQSLCPDCKPDPASPWFFWPAFPASISSVPVLEITFQILIFPAVQNMLNKKRCFLIDKTMLNNLKVNILCHYLVIRDKMLVFMHVVVRNDCT